jgi:TctA family transporter
VFIERPISAVLLASTVVMVLALIVLPQLRRTRKEAFQE